MECLLAFRKKNESPSREDDGQDGGQDGFHPRRNEAHMGSLASRMDVNQAKMHSNLQEMKASQGRVIAKMDAWLEWTKACREAMGANQQNLKGHRVGGRSGAYEEAPREKATHVLAAPQDRAPDILRGDPEGATYEETIGATEDRFGDQSLAVRYHDQLKTRTQDDGGSLQDVSTAIEQLAHRAFLVLHEGHVGREAKHSATRQETKA